MTVSDIANEIYEELDSPTDVSEVQIKYWLLSNIGQLNILIEMEYEIIAEEFSPSLGLQEKDIFKSLYLIKYMTSKISSNLGASAYDWSELSEGDSTIRRVSKNEVAKNYKQLRDSFKAHLDDLVYFYKKNKIKPSSYELPPY